MKILNHVKILSNRAREPPRREMKDFSRATIDFNRAETEEWKKETTRCRGRVPVFNRETIGTTRKSDLIREMRRSNPGKK